MVRMLDREVAVRADRRLTNRLAAAKLRFPDACIEYIDFAAGAGLINATSCNSRKALGCRPKRTSLPAKPAPAKTWLACAIARQAARLDHPCFIYACRVCSKMLPWPASMAASRALSTNSLVSNCWSSMIGAPTALMISSASISWRFFEERYRRKSALITAQLPVAQFGTT